MSMSADAYQMANAIPTIIFDVFAVTIALTFVHLYTVSCLTRMSKRQEN